MTSFTKDIQALKNFISESVVGKDDVIELVLISLVAQGHILIEDVPGVGKTTLAVALAQSIEGSFQRIQFTSDLLPSDVLGVTVFNGTSRDFEFKQGPVFTNVLLADEINRTTPKTQSALLEAMQDGSVTIERTTHPLPTPFMVIATQNPIEFHGTYPLPESQLDRFLMRISMGYPDAKAELEILKKKGSHPNSEPRRPVCTGAKIMEMQRACSEIRVDPALSKYILDIISHTRKARDLELGSSTRGALALYRATQARALVQGRDFITPDDVKTLVAPTLAHRIIVSGKRAASPTGRDTRSMAEAILNEIIGTLTVPA
jgi:MoxR-like ATPase